jgi:hypothetical protein
MATATARTSDIIELDTHDGEHDPDIHSVTSDQSIARINDVGAASPSAESTVPDGGFGWIIVLGCAVQTFIFYGTYPVHPSTTFPVCEAPLFHDLPGYFHNSFSIQA